MSPEHLTQLILDYRYWILIPISVIEGPVVAFVAGTLAALGYFNIWVLVLFFFARDMIMDAFITPSDTTAVRLRLHRSCCAR